MTVVSEPVISSPEIEAERRYAVRSLLRSPLLPSRGESAKEYQVVRRHSAWLKHWFAQFPAWDLHVDKEAARLRKTPADHSDQTRPAIDATSGSAFSPRRYALLCLALAALEKSEKLTTLGKIVESVVEFVAADPALQAAGLVFEISNHDQRRDLVHAVRLLLSLGLLRRMDGDEQQFLNRTGSADALYEIDRAILAAMLNVSHSPSALEAAARTRTPVEGPFASPVSSSQERAARINNNQPSSTEEALSRRIRARLCRALLDDPVLYLSDLGDHERAYFRRHRGYLFRQLREAAGLVPEVRREGIAMVDDAGDLTDLRLPEEGTDGHVSVLLAAWLAEQSMNSPGTVVPLSLVEEHIRNLIRIHGSKWRKAASQTGAEVRLAGEALLRLQGLRLIRITKEGVVPLAAVGRFAHRSAPEKQE